MRREMWGWVLLTLFLAACSSTPRQPSPGSSASVPAPAQGPRTGGGYYQNDGPATPPVDLASIPDAQPRAEPLRPANARPYVVAGRRYEPMQRLQPFSQEGVGSWYGRQFHGQPTATGESYDMFAMSAAHPTLPLPSYARVTNLTNGRSVVVRVNDRGPFLHGRIIDLSYAAAWKLGYVDQGSTRLRVELVVPGQDLPAQPVLARPAPAPVPVPVASPASGGGPYYLQLGAFASRVNADAYRAELLARLDWLSHEISSQQIGDMYRLRIGPFAVEAEARSIGSRIGETLGTQPFLVQ
ncbi:MAG: septal ring lytic transglycosylase RlpA family lipoprotein [Candidatus Dactylopiibacterium carminicum]|uniref:Endolytic peptidoglycan transglycosylase RlpA n=1 Tax=Candidatus Dactylopiibacterium carminicum TaxID=857335 RepID=A0A272EWX7_9RHOO|nr:septal ring lytic transglycosylase RlpA family protein [Candidatus Dactylopiibacterium carminicum]KAF7600064.1 septal ring lytic transglycosylase RlpA family protein [Candidatus Dactylopiibacterium carminicum]PAS94546.1 MAG: septal ring lytic transglycosylase RlpA family lipoprotein [Candidatus Dactylopiibacterium carminicum]PAS97585.1 MAG: septal ring lytic transglycosylase RlpA family lipoprotein [Candidatus Dactylopiibacterium carminicum]PAT00067.1 MAG: hypothetical protein BSR46_04845 [C